MRLLIAVLATLLIAAAARAESAGDSAVDYTAAGGETLTGLRPTGVGLPQIGGSGTVGIAELGSAARSYHDSGAYARDLATVGSAAKSYLDQRLAASSTPATRPARVCKSVYHRVKVAGHRQKLYRRTRKCTRPAATSDAPSGKPAIVLDIDETSLSNYDGLAASDFSAAGNLTSAAGNATAIGPTLDLYRDARAHGVAVFFITGRPAAIDSVTRANLKKAGYDQGFDGLAEKPGDAKTAAFKAGERAKVEQQGYDVILNMGDQESDLDGGHADKAFKLPNPFYFISD